MDKPDAPNPGTDLVPVSPQPGTRPAAIHPDAAPVALYLRAGAHGAELMLVRADVAVEITLNGAQALQLGMDCLAAASKCSPMLAEAAMKAIADAYVPILTASNISAAH